MHSNPAQEFLNNLWELETELEQVCRTGPPGYSTRPGGTGSLESILGLLKSFKIRALIAGDQRTDCPQLVQPFVYTGDSPTTSRGNHKLSTSLICCSL